ncbi:MAG: hypothetical protein GXP62_19750, partial [Oligoflexia bacterium]|nr:hypothetical protein [Oligoflexia bacterium]
MTPSAPSLRILRACTLGMLATLAACADSKTDGNYAAGYIGLDSGSMDAGLTLRLDVFPSDGTPDLLPQSVDLGSASGWDKLEVMMRPSVRVSGAVTGFLATPTAIDPTVPGEANVPVSARIDIRKSHSVAGASANTDADGIFAMAIPAGEDYDLVIVPEETARLPFQVRSMLLLAGDLDLPDLYLDYGAPVWGQVTRSNGTPVSSAIVHLIET